MATKTGSRGRRHERIRKKVAGTPGRPRLCVYKSLNHMYAQVVDDTKGHTLVSASTLDKEFKVEGHRGNVASARRVGELIGAKALEKGIKKLVFDRSGYIYHGAVKALADAARATGLEF